MKKNIFSYPFLTVFSGERRRWCYDSGDWNWPEKGDANCIGK